MEIVIFSDYSYDHYYFQRCVIKQLSGYTINFELVTGGNMTPRSYSIMSTEKKQELK